MFVTGTLANKGNHFFIRKCFQTYDTLPPLLSKTSLQSTTQPDSITAGDSKKVYQNKNLTDSFNLKPRADSLARTNDTLPSASSTLPSTVNDLNDSSYDKIAQANNFKDTSTTKQKIDTFHVKLSKDSLEAPVIYHADDSVVMDMPTKKIILYGKESKTKYKDNELTAPGIEFDQGNNMVSASLKKDSLGNVIAYPVFDQGNLKTVSDTIRFNMKTGKGLTKGSYTQQGEIFIYGEKIKKVSPDVFYAFKGRFTTCNLDTPHFAFVSKKIKFINKKMAITGPVHLEFEGVPIPIYLPFGIFPLVQGRHSGFIAPVFTQDQQLGLALQGIGYYKVLSDNWDITTTGTIYSYGSWMINPRTTYYKRYHYRGSFSFNYQDIKENFKGDPDYSQTKTFNIAWSHSMDSKARPGVIFAANVSAGSSQYNQQVPGNPIQEFNNQLQSSIQYSKVWKDEPFNLSITANHNQDAVTKTFNVTLPSVVFSINTLYPFRKKDDIGTLKWYENIGIGLNSSAQSSTTFSDDSTIVSKTSIGKQISSNLQIGASHTVPISLSLPPIGPLQVSPTVSYQEKWYQKKLIQKWNAADTTIDTTYQAGFFSARSMSFGVGLSTRIFGMYTFGKNSKIQAIHHEIRPSISFSYTPDMNSQYYYNLQYDSSKNDIRRVSVFDGINGGALSETKFAGLNFGIDNNVQMKVLNPKDTGTNAIKKVTLLESLSLTGSYNFLADSFALSNLSLSGGTSLFNNKITVNGSATLDPYQTDSTGLKDIDKLVWKDKLLTLGRLTQAGISLSTQFKGGDQKNKNSNAAPGPNPSIDPTSGLPLDQYETEMAYISHNPAEFTDFTIPWSINLSYFLNYTRAQALNAASTISQSVTFSGSLGLTAKWQLSLSSSYNITLGQLGYYTLALSRDLHCWQMSIAINNSAYSRSFTITINPKSALLRDLKLNRSRSYYTY